MMQQNLFDAKSAFAPPLTLRGYQQAAVDAVYAHLRARNDNPCVVIPTGGGKTPVMAAICRDAVTQWNGRVLVLAHVKELLEQSADKLRGMCRGVPIGVHSAGLQRRDTQQKVIVAGIQSVFKKACDLGKFDLIHVDEADLIPPDGDGMYLQFLADAKIVNPRVRVIGFTATPFRMKSGMICSPDGILNHVCYEIGVKELILDGFLSPLVTKNGQVRVDTGSLHARGGEFIAEEAEALMDVPEVVAGAVAEIRHFALDRKTVLIFAAGVKHGQHVVEAFAHFGIECGFITGNTPDRERAALLDRFRSGDLKYLANVNVLTVGFDAPNIDCVALLRPTNSPRLYYQMVGRGFRLFHGKQDCLVLDYGGNVLLHGPVDQLAICDRKAKSGEPGETPAKECPKCHSVIACGFSICPDCGYEFPPTERSGHASTATEAGILSGQVSNTTYAVCDERYAVHYKKQASETAPRTFRVDYSVDGGLNRKSEWVCLEHEGYARQKAEKWWEARSDEPCPDNCDVALEIANAGGLAVTISITVRSVAGEKFDRVIDYKLDAKPAPTGVVSSASTVIDDDIPF
jgi:DNA repair protein RadD